MKLHLIRNATLRLDYAGRRLLIDPYLADRHTRPSYTGASPNPLVDLPCAPEAVLAGVELVLISHLHSDHFDPAAQALLPRATPILCQPGDAAAIREKGFQDVQPVADSTRRRGVTITRTPGRHGRGEVLAEMGTVSGFVLEGAGEPTLYWTGDTIWCDEVAAVIDHVQPDVIVTHSCGAVWGDGGLIVMDAAQTVAVCRAAPASVVVATHMEALDHATVSRAALRAHAQAAGISPEQLRIPADGETLVLPRGGGRR